MTGRVVHTIAESDERACSTCRASYRTARRNEFKFGYNARADAASSASRRSSTASTSRASLINLSGSVANTGIAGQGASSGSRCPAASFAPTARSNGRAQPYDPYSLSFADSRERVPATTSSSSAAKSALIRMSTDRIGGTTYTFRTSPRSSRTSRRRFSTSAT